MPTLKDTVIYISKAPPTIAAAPISTAFLVALGTPPVATLVALVVPSFSRPAVTVTGRL